MAVILGLAFCYLAAEQYYTINPGLVWFLSIPCAIVCLLIPCAMYETQLRDYERETDFLESRISGLHCMIEVQQASLARKDFNPLDIGCDLEKAEFITHEIRAGGQSPFV